MLPQQNHLSEKSPRLWYNPWVGQVYSVTGTLFTQKPPTIVDVLFLAAEVVRSAAGKKSLTMRSPPFYIMDAFIREPSSYATEAYQDFFYAESHT